MRVVIYDDEDMEPITVIKLPGITPRDLSKRGMIWRVPVPEPVNLSYRTGVPEFKPMRIVTLTFEALRRRTRDRREQESLICFTKAAELAMLLNPDWLPGQRSAVDYLMRQNDALTGMLMRVLEGE